MPSSPFHRHAARRRPSPRPLVHEPLEPRLALSAAQGLVAVGSQPQGALTGKIVYTSAGHGWQWSDVLNRYATDRGNLLSLVEDYAPANVSDKVLRIIMSYTDFVARRTWHR